MPKGTAQKELKAIHSLLPQSLAAQENLGTGIDCRGYDEALIVIEAGLTSSNGSHAFKIQESSDNSTYADITGATFTPITTSNDAAVYVGRLNLRKRKRYIRIHNQGSNQALLASALVILSQAAVEPVTQVNAVAFNL
jgi:hypothetical protein